MTTAPSFSPVSSTARLPKRLPVVLTQDEVARLLDRQEFREFFFSLD